MARPRSPWRDYLAYLLVRSVVCVLGALPWRLCLALANILAALAYRFNRRHRMVALDNLRHAFPDLSEDELDRCVRGMYRRFDVMMLEMIHFPRKLHRTNYERHIRYPNPNDY